jgi:hypothetical protein
MSKADCFNVWFFAFTGAAFLAPVGPLRADMCILPRPRLDIQVRLENLDEYPGFDFYLKYGLAPGIELLKVPPGSPVHVWNHRGVPITPVYVLAVPRGQEVSQPSALTGDWLTKAPTAGLQSAPLTASESGTLLSVDIDGAEVVYRVRVEGNRLEAVWVATHESKTGGLVCIGVALSTSMTAAFFLWRRYRPGRSARLPAPAKPHAGSEMP